MADPRRVFSSGEQAVFRLRACRDSIGRVFFCLKQMARGVRSP